MIKPLNHQKREERDRGIQAAISPSFLHQILTSNPPWMRKWERKRMESRDSRGEVSKQINCFDFQLECLQSSKNISLYRVFDRNRPIEMIDGYDETVHDGPFWKISWPSNRDEGLRSIRAISVLKRLDLSPLDRDPTITMLPARSHLVRYNADFKARAFWWSRWSTSASDQRPIFRASSDPTLHNWPRHLP